ncbi:MAG: tripartite tricarboxylate transporter substrate-binding protein [Beijerinckiaceae bacterium]|nr:tripartite tricarboxylate transporter substrate-binding protein [Beijerinckiaceae bacterium]
MSHAPTKAIVCSLGALVGQLALNGAAHATDPGVFAGKTLSIATHTAPGGGYDLLARLTAQVIGRFLPGDPRVIVANMPGAGGLRVFNHAARLAPRDGTYLLIVPQGLTVHEPTVGTGMQASLRDMSWIGNFSKAANVLVVWHTSSVNTIEQAKQSEVSVGSTGPASIDSAIPLVMNSVLGTKFRVVYGYEGGSRINLAMERGELHGRGSNTWSSYAATFADAVRGKKLIPLVQVGLSKDAALPDTPLLTDLVRGDPAKEQIAEFLSLAAALSRPVAAPPDVPLERLSLLRDAFKKTMNDSDFQDAATKSGIEIDPMDGAETESAVMKMLLTPREVLAQVKAAIEIAK